MTTRLRELFMTSRWLHQFAGALAVMALIGVSASSTALAAKAKPSTEAGKLIQKKENALTAPLRPMGGIDTEAKHALVLEADTGQVLLDKGSEERIPPASMSKVMTARSEEHTSELQSHSDLVCR